MAGYFNSLSEALEVKARTMSINEKITYAAEARSSFCVHSSLVFNQSAFRYNRFYDNSLPKYVITFSILFVRILS